MTDNIHKWRTLQDRPNFVLLADWPRGVDADVIGLNEVLHPGYNPAYWPVVLVLDANAGAVARPATFPGAGR